MASISINFYGEQVPILYSFRMQINAQQILVPSIHFKPGRIFKANFEKTSSSIKFSYQIRCQVEQRVNFRMKGKLSEDLCLAELT